MAFQFEICTIQNILRTATRLLFCLNKCYWLTVDLYPISVTFSIIFALITTVHIEVQGILSFPVSHFVYEAFH